MTVQGVILGTLPYMSPEQARGEPVDFRSDQFALGSILYELLTGVSPFRRATAVQTLSAIMDDEPPALSDRRRDLPLRLERVVRRCLAKDREERYHSTKDLARDLLEASRPTAPPSSKAVAPPPTSTVGRSRELETVRAFLQRDDVRLLTLTGPAGIGKTRLAVQAAYEAAQNLTFGVELVSLAALSI